MLDFLVEQELLEAVSRGELDRILKNAGYVPPEVEALNEIGQLEKLAR